MREERGSQIWGGATLGLLIGLILAFFVGTYWTTVLYAVLIGAGSGLVSNVLVWVLLVSRKRQPVYRVLPDEERADRLREAEEYLQSEDLADFANDAMTLLDCVIVVAEIEVDELWRAGYGSLEAFWQAHERQHPQIRDYTAVETEVWFAGEGSVEERAEATAQRLSALSRSRQPRPS